MAHRAIQSGGAWLMDICAKSAGAVRPGTRNPGVSWSLAEARGELERISSDPKMPERPILVLGAYHAWPPVVWAMVRKLRRFTAADDRDIVGVPFLWETNLRAAAVKGRRHAIDAWGADQAVDVIGLSMGGLIARMLSSGDNEALGLPADLPRLNAVRIFTFGSPMQGSRRAMRIRPDQAARQMHPDSPIIQRVQLASGPEIISYGQLGDNVVGCTRTAPRGTHPIWSNGTLLMSHFTTPHNPWFLADMMRRLRGEPPLLAPGSAPPRD